MEHIEVLQKLISKERSKVWLFKLNLMAQNPLWRVCGVSTKQMKEECTTGATLESMRNSKYFLNTAIETTIMLATIAGVKDLQKKMRIASIRVNYSDILKENNKAARGSSDDNADYIKSFLTPRGTKAPF